MSQALHDEHYFLNTMTSRSGDRDLDAVGARLCCEHFGAAVAAILFYGGALRDRRPDTVLDFYVLVDDLRSTLPHPVARLTAHLLPPNVYAFHIAREDRTLSCKVAVMTTRDFCARDDGFRRASLGTCLRSRSRLLTPATRRRRARTVMQALTSAVTTAVRRVAPLMPPTFTTEARWRRVLEETYAAGAARPRGA